MRDLTITTRVEAVLALSGLNISNLEVETQCGEVYVGGVILVESVKDIVIDTITKLPGVTRVKTNFVITTPDHYLYGDAR